MLEIIILALGTSWASGINLYAALTVLGVSTAMGFLTLPETLLFLSHSHVIAAVILMYVLEFFADKIPGVDTIWDTLHTYIRIPAGGLMALGILGGLDVGLDQQVQSIGAFLAGSVVTSVAHSVKAELRAIINTSPEPVTNWAASFLEDILVIVGMFFAIFKPIICLSILCGFALATLWSIPKIWPGIRKVAANSLHPVRTVKADPSERISLSLNHDSRE